VSLPFEPFTTFWERANLPGRDLKDMIAKPSRNVKETRTIKTVTPDQKRTAGRQQVARKRFNAVAGLVIMLESELCSFGQVKNGASAVNCSCRSHQSARHTPSLSKL
jgi:hypothetical protein